MRVLKKQDMEDGSQQQKKRLSLEGKWKGQEGNLKNAEAFHSLFVVSREKPDKNSLSINLLYYSQFNGITKIHNT